MQPLTVTKREIARLGGPSVDTLSRASKRASLEAAGFPAPLPGLRPMRWPRAAVEAFLNGPAVAPAPAFQIEPDLDCEVEELTRRLAERGREIAAGEM